MVEQPHRKEYVINRDDLATAYLDSLPFTPYPVQEDALLAWFAGEGGILVSAPTGTGKTLIAEAALFEALQTGQRAYYTTPLIALTEQKFREIQSAAVRWGFSAEDVGLVTGHRRVNPEARVLVVVAEILLNRLLHPEAFDFSSVTSVVMDEFHSFNDPERGAVWELSLALLPTHVRLMLLSATVGNAVDFVMWLRQRHGHRVQLIQSTDRRVPLQFEWVGESLLSEHLEQMAEGAEESRRTPALLFCFNRSECWTIAEQLRGKSLLADEQRSELSQALARYDFSKGAGTKLKPILMRGVGVHHAGLLPRYRRIVEDLFQQKLLPVCVCTETLAAGINLPARSVVLTSLVKGPPGKMKLIDASAAHQMFGRAGRPQFDPRGFVYVLAHEDDVRIARWKAQYDQIPEDTRDPNLIQAKKRLKKKMPTRSPHVTYWNEEQFRKLIAAPPAKLSSRGDLPWRLLAWLLTLSPEVERLRTFARKRLLDDKQLARGEQNLHDALRTLWSAGFIELDPPPPPHFVRSSLAPPEAILQAHTVHFRGTAGTNQAPAAEEPPHQTDATDSRLSTAPDDEVEFGAGLIDDEPPETDTPAEAQTLVPPEQAAGPSEETVPIPGQGNAPPDLPAEDADQESGIAAVSQAPAGLGSFGTLLQQALRDAQPADDETTERSRERHPSSTDQPPEQEVYIPQWASPARELSNLLIFRSINPLYGWFLVQHLGLADRNELIQALESVLELPSSVGPAIHVPRPEELPAGPLAKNYLDEELLQRGLATPQELNPPPPPKDRPRSFEEPPPRPLTLASKLHRLFQSECPRVDVRVWPVWVAGDVLRFNDFQKYVTSRDLTRQEGLIFRHLLRLILLCGEFAQLSPPHLASHLWETELCHLAEQLTAICREVDPESTDHMLETAEQPDLLLGDGLPLKT